MKASQLFFWLIVLVGLSFFCGIDFSEDFLQKESVNPAFNYPDQFPILVNGIDAKIIANVADTCREYPLLPERMICVNQFVTDNFKYVLHDDGTVYGATKLFNDGGMCIDYSKFYCDMAKEYGYICAYGFVKDHVFSIVSNSHYYCNLDMELYECYEVG